MAKTKNTPGPKKQHGSRRDYHIKVSEEVLDGEYMSLADAFEQAAAADKDHKGIVAYVSMIIRERPEIQALLRQKEQ